MASLDYRFVGLRLPAIKNAFVAVNTLVDS